MVKIRFVDEVLKILRDLFNPDHYKEYFYDDALSSEGRKRIEKIAKILAGRCNETKYYLSKVRKNPTYENMIKYLISIMKCLERYGLNSSVHGSSIIESASALDSSLPNTIFYKRDILNYKERQ